MIIPSLSLDIDLIWVMNPMCLASKKSPKSDKFLHFLVLLSKTELIFYDTPYKERSDQAFQMYKKLGKSIREISRAMYVLSTHNEE